MSGCASSSSKSSTSKEKISIRLTTWAGSDESKELQKIGVFRTIYFLPAVLPDVAAALIWRWLFNSESEGKS